MLVPASEKRPKSIEELLGADLLTRLDRLDVVTRRTFPGRLPGERRSKRRGRSVEFADYRTYTPGDDLRHIDWKVFARLDRLFLKLFLDDEDLSVHIAMDASASMDAGSPSKLIFSARLAMALGYVALVGRNRLSVSCFGRGPLRMMTETRGRPQAQRLGRFLLDSLAAPDVDASAGAESFQESMRRIAQAPSGVGVMIILSDFLQPDGFEPGLRMVAARRGFDCTCLQVLSPGELDPRSEKRESVAALTGDLRLIDVETGIGKEVTMTAPLLQRYQENLDRFTGRVESECLARDMLYMLVRSDSHIETLILEQFRKRGLIH
jgi:uncharacterized protein (DUF58 family)